ncbi:MAG: HAMP domain-containing histidine kinase [Treponema sp.]|nr:HAMP domain-containing histidine kinase [Treponema sp.]
MKRNKDPRINAGYMSIKDYLIMLLTLSAINGFHMWIYQVLGQSGLMETNIRLTINLLMLYIMITAAVFLTGIAIVRHVIWNRPMRTISEAAKKITMGDFSVRISPSRRDGKKDFVEVMFDDFNIMAKELAAIETLKNDFIANVSHEIKTPLSVIQSYATALQKENLQAEERREYTATIVEATQRLTAMVANILKLNKLENQEILPKADFFELSEQLRQCAVAFEERWDQKNIDFEADLDEVNVCYDGSMLEIVWNNLLSNAVKFTNPGGKIILSLKIQNAPESESFAVISVTDTGIGMTKDTQKRIFDKFFQGDTSHAQEGNGLGLALVKKTVDLLGGTITVDSENGYGTTFSVCLKV